MRIGLFTDAYLPDINGVVSSVATLKHALEELGHTVFIITNHKGTKIVEDEDGHILRLPGLEIKKFYGYKMSSPLQFSADAYIERMDLDVIHIQTEAGVGMFGRQMAKNVLTTAVSGTFYNENGKKEKVGSSVMVQMPTGTGKTYVMAAVVKWFLDNHDTGEVWIVAHRRELVEQMQQTLDRFCLDYGEKEMELKAKVRIRVLSIQWLNRHIDELEGAECTPGLIVVDEAHHAIATSYQDLFERNRKALKLGMTATPCRMNKKSFSKLFEILLKSPCTNDFILRGYLAPYDYVVIGKYSNDQLTSHTSRLTPMNRGSPREVEKSAPPADGRAYTFAWSLQAKKRPRPPAWS